MMTCRILFSELSAEKVEENYKNRRLPYVSEMISGKLIGEYWTLQIDFAQAIYELI